MLKWRWKSLKMYKSRFSRWGLDKKNKEHEARAIMQMRARRHGRPIQIKLRGRAVDIARIESYLTRKGLSIDEVSNSAIVQPHNMDLVCRTPSPTPSLDMAGTVFVPGLNLTLPEGSVLIGSHVDNWTALPPRIECSDGMKTVKYLFADIAEYMTGCSEMGAWFEEDNADYRIGMWKGLDPAIGHLVH